MILIMLWMMITLSILFLFLKHPLSFGMILMIQTILISLIGGLLSFNFWFSYILLLIMVGGMLILFIYMTSVASNEMFMFSSKLMMLILLMLSFPWFIIFMDQILLNNNMFITEIMTINDSTPSLPTNKYFNWPNIFSLFIITIYLLVTLIMVVKITNISHGPLRQKF
nr:NADH dehydrogenase subunit 6 [Mantitheus pekinensis]